ncbi:tyrosine-type recombinase/integrase [Haloarcula amylolytica]|uniref:Integrase family protein n=1 Tax=Haloarcula amylolytica JCM 13557 TaxID=1227452 RepID=M0KX14_9EURY|nr:tyrosine-type recombinase/integrase [Haloarcula amylolytica]EMA25403.1 integrase family protein [Haloarcula amylolytica JCM 13557]
MTVNLDPLDPPTAKQMYLDERRQEVADATLQSHEYRLKQFVQWCIDDGIDNMNEISGRDIHRFRVKRRNKDELATASMKSQLATLRLFLRFCASIDAVEPGLDEKILLPTTTGKNARDELLTHDRAQKVLTHLEKFQYATLEHTLLAVIWHTGLRVGAAVGLDIKDYDADGQHLRLVHRPDEGTSLKNQTESERFVALSDAICDVLDDWLSAKHPHKLDEFDRRPLFATNRGRLSRNRARSIAYQFTRPCVYENKCPHDRKIETCESRPTEYAYGCPSSLSPHPIRRGSITYHLQSDTPERVVSDRMDVGIDVLDRHYDQRTKQEKVEQRRRYLPDE